MTVYKEIHKYNFEDREPIGESTSLFYRINKQQDLAGITIPLYDENGNPLLQSKSVNPTTSTQVIEPDVGLGYLGLKDVTVGAITAGSIMITPSKEIQTFIAPENEYYNSITVQDIVSGLDLAAENILRGNIRHDVTILGVTGNYYGDSEVAPVADGATHILHMFQHSSVTNHTLNMDGQHDDISA